MILMTVCIQFRFYQHSEIMPSLFRTDNL